MSNVEMYTNTILLKSHHSLIYTHLDICIHMPECTHTHINKHLTTHTHTHTHTHTNTGSNSVLNLISITFLFQNLLIHKSETRCLFWLVLLFLCLCLSLPMYNKITLIYFTKMSKVRDWQRHTLSLSLSLSISLSLTHTHTHTHTHRASFPFSSCSAFIHFKSTNISHTRTEGWVLRPRSVLTPCSPPWDGPSHS